MKSLVHHSHYRAIGVESSIFVPPSRLPFTEKCRLWCMQRAIFTTCCARTSYMAVLADLSPVQTDPQTADCQCKMSAATSDVVGGISAEYCELQTDDVTTSQPPGCCMQTYSAY